MKQGQLRIRLIAHAVERRRRCAEITNCAVRITETVAGATSRVVLMRCRKCHTSLVSLTLYEQVRHVECCCLVPEASSDIAQAAPEGNEPIECPFCARELSALSVEWRWRHVDRCAFRAELERLRNSEEEEATKERLRREQVHGPLRRFLLSQGVSRYLNVLVAQNLTLERLFLLKQSDLQLLKIPRSSAERLWQAISALPYRVSIANKGRHVSRERRERRHLLWSKSRVSERFKSMPRGSSRLLELQRSTIVAGNERDMDADVEDPLGSEDTCYYRNGCTQLAAAIIASREIMASEDQPALRFPQEYASEQMLDSSVEVVDLCGDHDSVEFVSAAAPLVENSSTGRDEKTCCTPNGDEEEAHTLENIDADSDADPMLLRFRRAVRADCALYERILLLDCVPLQDIVQSLEVQRLRLPNQRLLQYLEHEGISFSK